MANTDSAIALSNAEPTPVGWAMVDHLRTELVLDAVGMAITTRKPPAGTVHHTPVSRGLVCEFIAAEKTSYGVRRLCRVFRISPTSFYAWAARAGGPTAAEVEEAYAVEAARTAWVEHRRIYGARRLTAEVRDRGHGWNRKRVARLMRLGSIEGAEGRTDLPPLLADPPRAGDGGLLLP